MRSREEQIRVLADDFANPPEIYQMTEIAELHINEAIQRGRELERADPGQDTERLNWMERQCFPELHKLDQGWLLATDQVCRSSGQPTMRAAIDAAMNAENGQ
ncbi:hypothetical protein [Komagataeibacter oboediens]|uniref:hypothetical protein n=1 Tax=Komagataeibacter oboediens TaxID=65958 RepID=UPI000237E3E2|nr:hypothetical protein [Komagataeibacter oboediens]